MHQVKLVCVSEADRQRWNDRYRAGAYEDILHPSRLLETWLPQLPLPAGEPPRALDLAAGAGRNSLYLAAAGFAVTAIDVSDVALERLAASAGERSANVTIRALDLERAVADPELLGGPFELIIMMRYWQPDLVPCALSRLVPGGVFMAEVHLRTDADVGGPAGARFRAAPGALRAACALPGADSSGAIEILWEEEGIRPDPDGRDMALAAVVARRG